MKTNLLQKTTLLLFALLAMGGSNVWADAVNISSDPVTLTYAQATTSIGSETSHGKSVAYFAGANGGQTATYTLYSATEQEILITGEGASQDTSDKTKTLTYTFTDASSNVTSFTTRNLANGDWDAWVSYKKKFTLPAGTTTLVITVNHGAGSTRQLNFTAPTITPYTYASSHSVDINTSAATALTCDQATTTISKVGDYDHRRKNYFGNAKDSKITAYYELNSTVQQTVIISGEGASESSSSHTLTYSFLDEEDNETIFSTNDLAKNNWNIWTPYFKKFTLPAGITTLKITVVNGDGTGLNFTAPTFTPYSVASTAAVTISGASSLVLDKATYADYAYTYDKDSYHIFTTKDDHTDEARQYYQVYWTINNPYATNADFSYYGSTQNSGAAISVNVFNEDGTATQIVNGQAITTGSWSTFNLYETNNVAIPAGLSRVMVTFENAGSNIKAPTISPITPAIVSYTIPSSGVGTYCSPYKLDFSETGATPYIIKGDISEDKITATSVGGVVPANTGIIVTGTQNATINITVSDAAAANVKDNKLVGVLKATDITREGSYDYYVMSSGALYKVDTDGTIAANRAYLRIANGGSAHILSIDFSDGETTSISEKLKVKSEKLATATEYFDLMGRRVAQPTKGLYIVNGKKVIIK